MLRLNVRLRLIGDSIFQCICEFLGLFVAMYVVAAILDCVEVILLVIPPVFFRQDVSADFTPACVNVLPFVGKK